jgi:acyl-coenzyme A thioesterase 9
MRSNNIPWLTPTSPDLASSKTPGNRYVELSEEEKAELERPRHMSESYTSFHLPLASDKELFERYVNTSGGFREFLIIPYDLRARADGVGMGKLLER